MNSNEHSHSSLNVENSQNTTQATPSIGLNLQQYNHLLMQPAPQHGTHEPGMIDPSPLIAGHHSHGADGAAGLNEQEMANMPKDDSSTSTWRYPVQSTKNYLNNISTYFTPKFLSWMAISQFCVNGGIFTLVMSLSLPIFQQLGVSASRQQLYTTMMLSPWAMKPFIGVASDLFPIMGYNKRFFALYAIMIGLAGEFCYGQSINVFFAKFHMLSIGLRSLYSGCVVLLALFHTGTLQRAEESGAEAVQSLADAIVLCFTAVSFEAATLDILSEGKYSELMRIYPESGSSSEFTWAH